MRGMGMSTFNQIVKEGLFEEQSFGTSLAVQWLELHASTAGGTGLIPGWGTKILQVEWPKNK